MGAPDAAAGAGAGGQPPDSQAHDDPRCSARVVAAQREAEWTNEISVESSDSSTVPAGGRSSTSPSAARSSATSSSCVSEALSLVQYRARPETAEERAFTIDLKQLEPTSLSDAQKHVMLSVMACCLPRSRTRRLQVALPVGQAPQLQSPSANSDLGLSPQNANYPLPRTWELRFLLLMSQYLSLDPMSLVAVQPLLGGSIDPRPFLDSLGPEWESLEARMRIMLFFLNFSIAALGGYDARVRTALRTLGTALSIPWSFWTRQENVYASLLAAQAAALEAHNHKQDSTGAKAKKWLKVGAAGTVAGALLFVTGGLAAPAIGAGLASLGLAGGTVFLGSAVGAMFVATVFGATGAGLIGYKLNRRISSLTEFQFERLSGAAAGATLVAQGGQQCLSVQLVINGWLNELTDYHDVWAPLVAGRTVCATLGSEDDPKGGPRVAPSANAQQSGQGGLTAGQLLRKEQSDADSVQRAVVGAPDSDDDDESSLAFVSPVAASVGYLEGVAEHSEVYTLRWESQELLRFGEGLREVSKQDVAKQVGVVGLQQTVLKGVLMAVAWPVTLLQAGDIIDHPWLVVLNRCAQAATELANALEVRVAGRRPLTLVAYSMGARVVFLALEILARRKHLRAQLRLARGMGDMSSGDVNAPGAKGAPIGTKADQKAVAKAEKQAAAAAPAGPAVQPAPKLGLFDRMKAKLEGPAAPPVRAKPSTAAPVASSYASPSASPAVDAKPSAASSSAASSGSPPASGSDLPPDQDPSLEDADGVLFDVFLFGAPVPADSLRWRRVRSVVSGRLVNGYCKRDWALRFIYPLTSRSTLVAGLMPICDHTTRMALKAAKLRAAAERMDAAALAKQPLASPVGGSSGAGLSIDTAAASASSSSSASSRPQAGVDAPAAGDVADTDECWEEVDLTSDAAESKEDQEDDETDLGEDETGMLDGVDLTPEESKEAQELTLSIEQAADAQSNATQIREATSAASSSTDAGSSASRPTPTADFSQSAASAAAASASQRALKPLVPINYFGIESFDLTPWVSGHKDYPKKMEVLLRKCGYQP